MSESMTDISSGICHRLLAIIWIAREPMWQIIRAVGKVAKLKNYRVYDEFVSLDCNLNWAHERCTMYWQAARPPWEWIAGAAARYSCTLSQLHCLGLRYCASNSSMC